MAIDYPGEEKTTNRWWQNGEYSLTTFTFVLWVIQWQWFIAKMGMSGRKNVNGSSDELHCKNGNGLLQKWQLFITKMAMVMIAATWAWTFPSFTNSRKARVHIATWKMGKNNSWSSNGKDLWLQRTSSKFVLLGFKFPVLRRITWKKLKTIPN